MTSETIARKLTTILAADIVGYSKLMSADEEATLTILRNYREVIDALIAKHDGRIVSTAGDSVLAEFKSPVEAVRCAIAIQEDLRVRNSEIPDDTQMWWRIGINVGDVMSADDDLFGDAVNVAARLEALAPKGGICISGTVFDQVKNKVSIAFNSIGEQKVKNIPNPIAAFELVPGDVLVKTKKPEIGGRKLVLITSCAFAAALVVAFFILWSKSPSKLVSKHPFDGDWRVTVNSLTGCRNNFARSYAIRVRNGQINEEHHMFPKTGAIDDKGKFSIKTTDRAGKFRNSQTGTIAGSAGEGRFQGRKPTCSGIVTLARLE